MSQPIAKVTLGDLEAFLSKGGEHWDCNCNDDRGHQNSLPHGFFSCSPKQLIHELSSAIRGAEHVYVLKQEPTPGEDYRAIGQTSMEEIPTIGDCDLADFVQNQHVENMRWSLCLALSIDDVESGFFIKLMPEEEPYVEESPTPFRLNAMTISNFKGIGEPVRIELKPITLLFGPNSAGKSTIIHALHYAREVFERRNLNADKTIAGGQFVDLGGFRNFVHNRDLDQPVTLGFEMSLSEDDLPSPLSARPVSVASHGSTPEYGAKISSASVSLTIAWSELRGRLFVREYSVVINQVELARIECQSDGRSVFLANMNYRHPILPPWTVIEVFADLADAERDPSRKVEKVFLTLWPIEDQVDALPVWGRPLSLARLDQYPDSADVMGDNPDEFADTIDGIVQIFSHLLVGPGQLIRDYLSSFRYLGPIREIPPRGYAAPSSPDPSRWASGIAAWDELTNGPERLVETVSNWLADSDRLDTHYRVERRHFKRLDLSNPLLLSLASGRAFDDVDQGHLDLSKLPTEIQVVLVSDDNGLDLLPADVGIGISQILPVVVAAVAEGRRLLLIEQPELHVHPRVQAELGDLFIESCLPNSHHYLIETHSEHLILRILRRIRETGQGKPHRGIAITGLDVAVNYINAEPQGTRIRLIDIDTHGDFVQPWPDDFFEIDFYERFGNAR